MSTFLDMVVIALLSPITNYSHKKRCELLEKHSSSEDRQLYAAHWVAQTKVYSEFVRAYLGLDSDEGGDC